MKPNNPLQAIMNCPACESLNYDLRCICGELDDQHDEDEPKRPFRMPSDLVYERNALNWGGMDGYREVRE